MAVKQYGKIVEKINKINEIMLVATLVIMFIVLMAQIFARFIFFIPLPASQDILTFLMVAAVFMGSGIAVANHKQIALEFFVHSMPNKIRNKFMIFADGVSIFFLAIIIMQAYELMGKTKHTLVGAAQIPQMYYYLLVLIGCMVMTVNYINQILIKITGEEKKEVE